MSRTQGIKCPQDHNFEFIYEMCTSSLQNDTSQPEVVGDDSHAGERHGEDRQHRTKISQHRRRKSNG